MSFVVSDDRLYSVLKRLHNTSSSLVFKNKDDDIQFIIRSDIEGSLGHFMSFDVIMNIGSSKTLLKCYQNYADAAGFNEDIVGDEYLVASFEIDKRKQDVESVQELKDFLNKMSVIRICPCRERFIHDEKSMCTFCELVATEEDLVEFECPVCRDQCHNFHGITMKCCGNKIHKKCDDIWYTTGNNTCPFCRTELPKRESDDSDIIRMLVSSIASEVQSRLNETTD